MCSSTRQRHRALADRPHRVNMVLIQLPTALIASAAKGHNRYAVARRFARHAHRGFTKGALTIEPAFPDDGQCGIAKMTVGVKQFEHQSMPGRSVAPA